MAKLHARPQTSTDMSTMIPALRSGLLKHQVVPAARPAGRAAGNLPCLGAASWAAMTSVEADRAKEVIVRHDH
jgi:hypothetical protein